MKVFASAFPIAAEFYLAEEGLEEVFLGLLTVPLD